MVQKFKLEMEPARKWDVTFNFFTEEISVLRFFFCLHVFILLETELRNFFFMICKNSTIIRDELFWRLKEVSLFISLWQ